MGNTLNAIQKAFVLTVLVELKCFQEKEQKCSLFSMSHMSVKSFCNKIVIPMLWKYKCLKNVLMLPWGKKVIYVAYMTYLFLYYKSKASEIYIFAIEGGKICFTAVQTI